MEVVPYVTTRSHNHNHGVDTSNFTSTFTPEEVSALIQANVWDYICSEQRKNWRRINNNDDSYIIARVNDLGSIIETLQETVSWITDDPTDNGEGNNNGENNNGGGNNNSGRNKNVGKMHTIAMLVEILDLIATTLSAVQEKVDHFIIWIRLGWQQQRCMTCIMFQIIQNLILWHVHNKTLIHILLVLEITRHFCHTLVTNATLSDLTLT